MVRLIDGQREGHFQVPFDWRRIDFSYLPQDKLYDYAYNEAVEEELKDAKKMYQIKLEGSSNELEYNKKLTNASVSKFGLKQFVKRNYL